MSTSITLKNVNSIAIGGFDGMHIAHQELFSKLDDNHGAIVVIETGYANMTPGMLRQDYIHHPIYIYDLEDIKHLDAEGFITKLLETFPTLEHIVVGYDFHFGKDRAYEAGDLQYYFKGRVTIVSEVRHNGQSIHSHIIREQIRLGNFTTVKHLLGRDYSVRGTVVSGQGLGKKALVPTINVITQQLLPKEGVYVSLTRINNEASFHPSVTFYGHRVCTDNSIALETHLIGQEVTDVKNVEIVFLKFIRDNQKFDTLILLKEAIQKDIAIASKELQILEL